MAMDNKRNKEYILKVYLFFNKRILEEVLRLKLVDIELEKQLGERKVDILAVSSNGHKIYVEVQLNQSDNLHLQQVLKLIEYAPANESIMIAWIAIGFNAEQIQIILKAISKSKKNIEFLAVALELSTLVWLEYLNSLDIFEVRREMKVLDKVEDMLHVELRHFKHAIELVGEKGHIQEDKTTYKQRLLEAVVVEIRTQLEDYLPIYRSKRAVDNRVVVGAGIADAMYHIGIDRRNNFYIELKLSASKQKTYEELLKERELIDSKLDYRGDWDIKNLRIITRIPIVEGEERQIKEVAIVLRNYVKTFYALLNS